MAGHDEEQVTIEELVAMSDILGCTEQIANLYPGWKLLCLIVAHSVPSTHEKARTNALRLARHLRGDNDLAFTLNADDYPQLLDLIRNAPGQDDPYDEVDIAREEQPPLFVSRVEVMPHPQLGTANELSAFLAVRLYCYSQEEASTLEVHSFALNREDAMALANELRNVVRET